MRTSEWIQIGFAIILAAAAWMSALPARRRWIVTLLAAFAICAVAVARSLVHFLAPLKVSVARDWLTAALMLVPYWQTGQFFMGPNEKIQAGLAAFDRKWLPGVTATSGTPHTRIGFSLEIAYLFCYPLVPLGLAALCALGLRQYANVFWFVVLVSTYICYAITPFVPALPPRSIAGAQTPSTVLNAGRAFNRWILRHGSIHAISFPSAHVASALAVSLVLLWFAPLTGLVFLVISICIAVAAVVGRYHYALDVLFGALTALVVFLASYAYLKGLV
ncbi:MAG TPA: phosphatase PAP2 family protein [Edaphobacter sp.]|nr:phosphatase PAP2 family protein [Edaphobacter sp.]